MHARPQNIHRGVARVLLPVLSGMWVRSRENFVNFEHGNDGYVIIVTDLYRTFTEQLSRAEIEKRGDDLGSDFALSSGAQVSAFLDVLAGLLARNTGIALSLGSSGPELRVNASVAGADVRWTFVLAEVPHRASQTLVAGLVQNLLGVVERLGHEIVLRDQIIADKNEVIGGMDDAMVRRVDYRPPRHLDPAFRDLSSRKFESGTGLEIANQFWPSDPLFARGGTHSANITEPSIVPSTAQTEAAPTETARTDTERTETAQTDTARIDTARSETTHIDSARTDTATTEGELTEADDETTDDNMSDNDMEEDETTDFGELA